MPYLKFYLRDIVEMARERIKNKKDVVILWCGFRGDGKSTGSYKFCRKLGGFEVEHLGKVYGIKRFNPEKNMLYTRKDAIEFIQKKKYSIIDIDEMINVGYNREFSQGDQQALIKSLNQFRSNFNIISMCNPFFYDLDPDLRSLIWMRIDIIRKGIGLIHTPNNSIYNNDIWDTKYNQKIESSWSKKSTGTALPQYKKLSTFRGVLVYPPLTLEQELKYERIRDEKRALANPISEADISYAQLDIYDKLVKVGLDGKLTREIIEQTCLVHNIKYSTIMQLINRKLKDKNVGKTATQIIIDDKKEKKVEKQGYTLPPIIRGV